MEYKLIIEACKKGKREAQVKLYDFLASKLFTICLRYSSNREEAKDLVQESFIKIFQNIHNFNHEGSFEGWCKRITVNTALTHIKSRVFLQGMKSEDVETKINLEDNKLSDNMELNELLNMLNHLPLQKKVIFNLYVIEGYSHGEIAEMLNITEGASRGQLAKAKEALREIHISVNKIKINANAY